MKLKNIAVAFAALSVFMGVQSVYAYEAPDTEAAATLETVRKTPIEGLEGCYTLPFAAFYVNIVDENGNKLVETNFRDVDTKLGPYDTLKVWYPEGMQDLSAGLLDKNLNVIVPRDFYTSVDIVEKDGKIYAEAHKFSGEENDFFEITVPEEEENKVSDDAVADEVTSGAAVSADDIQLIKPYSDWAETSLKEAIAMGIVPSEFQSDYTKNITRKEFCRLAMETYAAVSGKTYVTEEHYFSDASDNYINSAYELKIVNGMGNGKFDPDSNITRQQAAVMLCSLANVLEKDMGVPKADKYIDEEYFADWAKDKIYAISGMKSGDIYIMTGTGQGKFSPWMTYTREQAISTMLRLAKA